MTIALCRRSAEDEARRIAVYVAKLPEPPRKKLTGVNAISPHHYGPGNRASVLPISR